MRNISGADTDKIRFFLLYEEWGIKMNKMIYLDNAATTQTLPEVLDAMEPYYVDFYGNPSTIYEFGDKSRRAMEHARKIIADTINANPEEIYFTSGGTEADNWALKEAAELHQKKTNGKKGHIITTPIEHHAILHSCDELENQNCRVTYLPVDEYGTVKVNQIERNIGPDTCLISVMFANNEIGTIQPVAEIAAIAKRHSVLFHTDAVQAYGHQPINVRRQQIDMLSASAHKFGGPKGVGFLYIRKGIELPAYVHGGAQESNLRAGTENVPGIVGMGKAAQIAAERMQKDNLYMQQLRNQFMRTVVREIPFTKVNGHVTKRLANNANFCFQYVHGEAAAILLDTQGICVSSGSACSTGAVESSHVLKAIGVTDEHARGAIRFTFSADITHEEMMYTVEKLKMVVEDLRKKSPEYHRRLDG